MNQETIATFAPQFYAYFDAEIARCHQRGKELLSDDRRDEATFEKVKANVYDLSRTVFSVAEKTGKGDIEAIKRFFLLKMEQIPSNWSAAYDQAKQHDDAVRMQLEQIKLDTMNEIKQRFDELWEGAQ